MRQRRGFALIAALWFVAVLSGLAMEFSLAARNVRESSLNARDDAMARGAAEAGLDHARAKLKDALRIAALRARARSSAATSPDGDPWLDLALLMPDTVRLDGQRYAVDLRDVGARLNVNSATDEELRRLFLALRVDARLADQLAQRIADWKDADDMHRARGAELDAYLSEGAPILPANSHFRDVREIQWILGMTPELYHRVVPSLTTVGSGRINLRSASRPVLLALPGITEEAVGLIQRVRREWWRPLDPNRIHQMLSASARAIMLPHLPFLVARTVLSTTEVEVRSLGWAENGRVYSEASALVIRVDDDILTSGRWVR